MPKTSIADRMLKALAEQGLSQADLARLTGASTANVSRWCTGERLPGSRWSYRIADALGVSVDFLLTGKERTPPVTSSRKDARSLPLLGATAAGEPMARIYEATDIQWFDFSDQFLLPMYKSAPDPERAVLMRVDGDSMEGELPHGSLVFIDRGPRGEGFSTVNEEDIYLVSPPDEKGLTLKRVSIQGKGANRVLLLLPSGRALSRYQVKPYPLGDGVKIQSIVRGRVVGKFEVVGRVGKVM